MRVPGGLRSPESVAVSKIWPPTGTLGEAAVVNVAGNWAVTAGENSEVSRGAGAMAVAVAVTNRSPAGIGTVKENDCGPAVTVTVAVPRYVSPSASAEVLP